MIKEKDILIRVGPVLKEEIRKKAESLGLSMSGYLRMLATKDLKNQH